MTSSDVSADPVLVTHIVEHLKASLRQAEVSTSPYRYWICRNMLPAEVAADLCGLPFSAPPLNGLSGKREVHNATRSYLDAVCQSAHPVAACVAAAFQSPEIVGLFEEMFDASLGGTYLRAEYAQDVDGFWLEPHSDLGVKKFTLLLYLSDDPEHAGLGTDIYGADKQHIGASPFARGTGMIFVPSDITIHGFERRTIQGVRKSLIVNYVTDEWRAREQLAFGDMPVRR